MADVEVDAGAAEDAGVVDEACECWVGAEDEDPAALVAMARALWAIWEDESEDEAGCWEVALKEDWARKAARKLARNGRLVDMMWMGWSDAGGRSFFLRRGCRWRRVCEWAREDPSEWGDI